MPRRSELRITKRTVDSLRVEERDAVFWDRDLPQEQHRDLSVIRCPARPALELVRIHDTQVYRMVAEDARASFFHDDMDAGHVVLLLLPGVSA